jgi:hypothetical protein
VAYPIPANRGLSTLITVCKHELPLVDALKACTARIEVDTNDSGYGYGNDNTVGYLMLIEMPPEIRESIKQSAGEVGMVVFFFLRAILP